MKNHHQSLRPSPGISTWQMKHQWSHTRQRKGWLLRNLLTARDRMRIEMGHRRGGRYVDVPLCSVNYGYIQWRCGNRLAVDNKGG